MKIRFLFFNALLAFLLALPTANSQETKDTTLMRIETTDGNIYIGQVVSQDADVIQLKTESLGVLTIRKTSVSSMEAVQPGEMKGQTYWHANGYASTRYFFNTNGYGLQAGEGYYQNTWVLINGVNVGVTKNFSIGAGMIPTFLFSLGDGGAETPVWLTPKITIPVKKDKVNLGIGALHGFLLGSIGDGGSAGVLYGTATFGPRDHNLSMGLGLGYASGAGIAKRPTISVSYLKRRSPKWAFLTENYLINADDVTLLILSGGARYIGRKISIDFGAFTFLMTEDQDFFPVLPWLSLSVPFKLKKK